MSRVSQGFHAIAAALLACACTPSPPAADDPLTGSASASESGDGGSEAGDEPILDLADHHGPGCAKVDLLFVIDNSISMVSEQGNLIASFPEFIDGILSTLDSAESYHLGVITTDAYAHNQADCQLLGALVTQTGGDGSSASECGPFVEGRYLTEADDLELGFACAGQVGIAGSNDERPMQALALALGDELGGSCNAGFARDDALLVIVVITDEEDDHTQFRGQPQGSPGDPQDWFDAVVAAKLGIESNVVVLSIIGGAPQNECGFPVGSGAQDSPRLTEFTQMFTHGFLGDVCAWSYGEFFASAVEVIETACDDFTLP